MLIAPDISNEDKLLCKQLFETIKTVEIVEDEKGVGYIVNGYKMWFNKEAFKNHRLHAISDITEQLIDVYEKRNFENQKQKNSDLFKRIYCHLFDLIYYKYF